MTQEWNMNELFALEAEIAGINAQGQMIYKGLLQQDISYAQKFHLEDILYKIAPYKERLQKLRGELLQQYGKQTDGGNLTIPEFIETTGTDGEQQQVPNEDWQKANSELMKLMETQVSVEVHPFSATDFDFNATEYYPVFNKMIRRINEETQTPAL